MNRFVPSIVALVAVSFPACKDKPADTAPAERETVVSSEDKNAAKAPAEKGPSDQAAPAVNEPKGETAKTFFASEDDIDGDGEPEAIVVTAAHVSIGKSVVPLPKDMSAAVEEEFATKNKFLRVEVMDFNPKKPGKQVVLVLEGIEDSVGWSVFVYKDKNALYAGSVGGGTLTLDAGLLKSRSHWCGVTTNEHWALRKNELTKVHEAKTGTHDDALCAACPFVYAGRAPGKLVKQGEILRNLRAKRLETTQELLLTRLSGCSDRVYVRLSEEKRETTYLDSVELSVGGVRVRPAQCGRAAHCLGDGRYHVLRQGDVLEVEFAIPAAHKCAPATVVAHGYYVPGL